MDNLSQHEEIAQLSKGISSNNIYDSVITEIKPFTDSQELELADVGCGEGHLLRELSNKFKSIKLSGVDLVEYPENKHFKFIKQNFNKDFEISSDQFDLVLAIEVIEHLENPRHFLRQLNKITKKGGKIIISTPNPYSLLSLLSFLIKGYHSSFGPKNYPAHITEVSLYSLKNMINEIEGLNLNKYFFIPNGRIPGTSVMWNKIIPFAKGKLFSDNYICVINKD